MFASSLFWLALGQSTRAATLTRGCLLHAPQATSCRAGKAPVHLCPTSRVTPRLLPQDFWQRVHPRFGNLAIRLCRHAADADGPNDFLVDDNGQAPFNGDSTRQLEDRGPVIRHQGLLKRLAGTLEVDGRLGLLDGDLDTPNLCLVQTLQIEQIPAVVYNDN